MTEPDADRSSTEPHDSESTSSRSRFDTLTLPEPLQNVLRIITREREVSLAELVNQTGQDEAALRSILHSLIEQGFVQTVASANEQRYRTNLTPKRGRRLPNEIWQRLEEP
jgi:DNA-binding MarR family transcriptional regulator